MEVRVYRKQPATVSTDDWAISRDEEGNVTEWDMTYWPEICRCDPVTWDREQKDAFCRMAIEVVQANPDTMEPEMWTAEDVDDIPPCGRPLTA